MNLFSGILVFSLITLIVAGVWAGGWWGIATLGLISIIVSADA